MWSRTSRTSDVIPISVEHLSAMTAPERPAPTMSRSTFFGAELRSPDVMSCDAARVQGCGRRINSRHAYTSEYSLTKAKPRSRDAPDQA
eukprot:scaffold1650_cov124-Isochrysis_galbana.AAC.9